VSLPVAFNPGAQRDLDRIEGYLAQRFSPRNAASYAKRIVSACEAIGFAPYQGANRDDLGLGVRSKGFQKRVTITFAIEPERVVILGIFYAGRLPR
jgi:toxin ParE1/3/4